MSDFAADRLERARENLTTQIHALELLRETMIDAERDIRAKPARYQALCQSYDRQYASVCKAEEAVIRLEDVDADDGYWALRAEELARDLSEEYGQRGPQYDILIRRLVFAEVSVEQLEKSGRNFDTGEYRNANRAVLEATQALQKYTESQKSEVVQKAQQNAMLLIMEVAERVIAPKYPEAWAMVVDEIERLLPAGSPVDE